MAGPKRKPLADRFARFVHYTDDLFSCWLWTGALLPNGYGVLHRPGKRGGNLYAHRVAWEMDHGPIPPGLFVLHRCDVRSCARIDHLFLGTPADNMTDMVQKRRHKHGAIHNWARLTEAHAREILASSEPTAVLMTHYGVSAGAINGIRDRRSWKHLTP